MQGWVAEIFKNTTLPGDFSSKDGLWQ